MDPRLPAALLAVTHALARPLGLDEVVRTVLGVLSAAVGSERATLYRRRPDGHLVAFTDAGNGVWSFELAPGVGIAGWVAATGQAAVVPDAASDWRFHAGLDDATGFRTRAVLAVPLRDAAGELVAVVQLLNKADGFDAADAALVAEVGPACAMAIANADLVASLEARNAALDQATLRLQRRADELEALAGLERTIGAAHDEGVVLHAALELLVTRWPGTVDATALLRGDRNHVVAAQPGPDGGPVRLRIRRISKQWADSLLERFDAPAQAEEGRTTHVSAPVVVDGERIGALQLRVPAGPDEPALGLVALVAAAVGRAIGALRRAAREARDDRLALVGQMMGSLLHDLRNPLSAITGYLELLAEDPDPAERAEVLRRGLAAVASLEAMSQEVLEFSRGSTHLARTPTPLGALVGDFVEIAVPDLRRYGAELRVEGALDGEIAVDAVRIRRVLANLARNAGEAGATTVVLRVLAAPDAVTLDLVDDGPGIHPEIRDRLFQPFATFGKAGGTGLGLAMARRTVEAHGGTLGLPPVERGAVFRLTLPR